MCPILPYIFPNVEVPIENGDSKISVLPNFFLLNINLNFTFFLNIYFDIKKIFNNTI